MRQRRGGARAAALALLRLGRVAPRGVAPGRVGALVVVAPAAAAVASAVVVVPGRAPPPVPAQATCQLSCSCCRRKAQKASIAQASLPELCYQSGTHVSLQVVSGRAPISAARWPPYLWMPKIAQSNLSTAKVLHQSSARKIQQGGKRYPREGQQPLWNLSSAQDVTSGLNTCGLALRS